MPVKVALTGNDGIHQLNINKTGAALVEICGNPPEKASAQRVYSTKLKNSAGSSDMKVVGSIATPQDFFIQAREDADTYITSVSFLLSGAGAVLSEFCNISALTNGCQFLYEDDKGTQQINDDLLTNFDFIRLSSGQPAFGDGNTVFRANNVVGSAEAYIPFFNIKEIMSPYGLRLTKGTQHRLIMRIRDNLSTVGTFNVSVLGYLRFPD